MLWPMSADIEIERTKKSTKEFEIFGIFVFSMILESFKILENFENFEMLIVVLFKV